MLGLRFRDLHQFPILEELEGMVASFRVLWLKEHAEDGTHRIQFPTNLVPVGAVMPFAGPNTPSGWLLCDGSQVSRVTYKSLFEVIGTTYGAGDGSTTFHLPDLRQRFPLGKASAGTGSMLGATGGSIDHTHSIPAHAHAISGTTSTDGSHSHTVDPHTHPIASDGAHAHTVDSHSHTISTQAAVGQVLDEGPFNVTGPHNHGGSTGSASPGTSSAGNHAHGGATGSTSPGTNESGSHAHTVSGATGTSGGGTTGTANPPFIALHFIIFAGA